MSDYLKIIVITHSGLQAIFDNIQLGFDYSAESEGIKICIGGTLPAPVKVIPKDLSDPIKSIEYYLCTEMKNYHKVIPPDCGRNYMSRTQLIDFWEFNQNSYVGDFKMPIYIFLGQDLNMSMAFGLIGKNYETSFKTIEPTCDRALIAYMRRLTLLIKRGTDLFPIPESVAKAEADGSITEHLYFTTSTESPKQPWILTLRDFSQHQKRIFDIPDVSTENSLLPLWCSWTDWFSDNVTQEVILANVKEGVKLGIKNYIIDDGWFGPGLDSDFDVELNIGDWETDPTKITDMKQLVQDIKNEGAAPMIWCAPHAVAAGAKCFDKRKPHLIMKEDGEYLMTWNQFHALCFMDPEAREIMADICAGFIKDWDMDGAKYDLFNCVPIMKCSNPDHKHDVSSMMEGLELTLKLISERCSALKKDYIVELKQNYGTPFLSRYGTMTRAGDTPYDPEGNYLRTLYVQAYSPYSINDYQTITPGDTAESTACIVIKMISVGIPTYSIDFFRLNQENKDVIKNYNEWYIQNLDRFKKHRIPLDAESNILKIPGSDKDVYFMVNRGGNIEALEKSSTILNGTYNNYLYANYEGKKQAKIAQYDCFGVNVSNEDIELCGQTRINIIPGGKLEINF